MSGQDAERFRGLLDAEARHRADPDTFSIPRSDVRRALRSGDRVKLLFGFGEGDRPAAERMWVEVAAIGGARYRGRLDNEPVAIADLAVGATVDFGPEHVAAIWRETGHEPRPDQLAIVSDHVWRDGERPTRAVRGLTPDDSFSGWIVLGPGDPPEPPADLAGFGPVSHEELTDRHRSFDTIEDEAPSTRWRWDPTMLEWQPDHASAGGEDAALG